MMKFKSISIRLALIAVIAIASIATADAQCKSFTKRKCLPDLSPYIHNGQLNSAVLREGESAELEGTFNSGQDYRITVCGQENLGDVSFRVMDADRNVLYDSKENNFKQSWDFSIDATQQLIIEVNVPANDAPHKIVSSGCVTVLIGFKTEVAE